MQDLMQSLMFESSNDTTSHACGISKLNWKTLFSHIWEIQQEIKSSKLREEMLNYEKLPHFIILKPTKALKFPLVLTRFSTD